jgi:hypothetical protein
MGVHARRLETTRVQPALHHPDFVGLGHLDALGQELHGVGGRSGGQERRHLERLGMVADHALHELYVRFRVFRGGWRRRAHDPARLTGGPG